MEKAFVWLLIMAVPAVVWALAPYKSDPQTGIVAIDTETVIDQTNLHDSFGRFFVPDKTLFRVPFETSVDGKVWKQIGIAASGVGAAPTKDKVCPIRVKVRIEPEGDRPKDPALEKVVSE